MQLLEGGAANLVCVCVGEEIVAETRAGEGSDGVGCVLLPFLHSVLALQFSLRTSFWYVSFLFLLFRGFSSLWFMLLLFVCLWVGCKQWNSLEMKVKIHRSLLSFHWQLWGWRWPFLQSWQFDMSLGQTVFLFVGSRNKSWNYVHQLQSLNGKSIPPGFCVVPSR